MLKKAIALFSRAPQMAAQSTSPGRARFFRSGEGARPIYVEGLLRQGLPGEREQWRQHVQSTADRPLLRGRP